jgi:hypothetical protein
MPDLPINPALSSIELTPTQALNPSLDILNTLSNGMILSIIQHSTQIFAAKRKAGMGRV